MSSGTTTSSGSTESAEGAKVKRSPRRRLLDAAHELFYAEGVQTVGIDRVLDRAGVAKASLYSAFGSKEELIHAYLEERRERQLTRLRERVEAAGSDPVAGMLAVFDAQAEKFADADYRGCAFIAALPGAPEGGGITAASEAYRDDIHALLAELAARAGVADPDRLALGLHMLYDGGASAAYLEHAAPVAEVQRAAAEALVRAALPD